MEGLENFYSQICCFKIVFYFFMDFKTRIYSVSRNFRLLGLYGFFTHLQKAFDFSAVH